MTDPVTDIGLDEAIQLLRQELVSAHTRGAGASIQFPIKSLTVELKVGVTNAKEGKAGFRVPVVNAELGGSLSYDREAMQTITLVLDSPVDLDGRPVKVARSAAERKK